MYPGHAIHAEKEQHVCPSWSCCMYRYMGEIFFFAQIILKPINEYELDPQDVFAHVF
jgi:poly(3-hydroxybutyrate) depolymerase